MTNPCVCKLVLSFILWATCDMADLNTAFQQTNSDEAHCHKFSERDFMSFWLQVYCAWSRDAYCSQSSVSNLTKHCGFYGPYKPTLTCDTYRMIDFMWMNVGFFCKIKSRFCRGSLLSSMIWCFVICSIWIRRKFTFTISRFRQSRCASVDCEWLDWRE